MDQFCNNFSYNCGTRWEIRLQTYFICALPALRRLRRKILQLRDNASESVDVSDVSLDVMSPVNCQKSSDKDLLHGKAIFKFI